MTADRLSPQREAEIAARAEAATPGPWGLYDDGTGLIDVAADLEDTGHGYRCRRYVGQMEADQIDNDPTHRDWTEEQDRAQVAADAEFIANARTDVPALLAELAAVRAERDEARQSRPDAGEAIRGALNSVQGTVHHLPLGTLEILTERLMEALAASQSTAEDPKDRRRRIYVDGKGDGWIDLTGDPRTGERELTGITNQWKIATADEVRDDTGSLREIGRCW